MRFAPRVPASNYEIVRLANGVNSIRSKREGETFHPVIGPVAEAEALYVQQLNLIGRMAAGGEEFVIWDVGLGGAANVLTVLRHTRELTVPLRVISFDHTLEPAAFAVANATALGYVNDYEPALKTVLEEGRLAFKDGNHHVDWQVQAGDFPGLLARTGPGGFPAPHVVLFDAYSPARNPAMWTLPLFTRLFAHLSPQRPCAMPTYSRSTMLRVTLLLAGFHVGRGHATGEKEETTIAANTPELIAEPLGEEWLRRAAASTSAEPMREPVYRQARLTTESLNGLRQHPQFQR